MKFCVIFLFFVPTIYAQEISQALNNFIVTNIKATIDEDKVFISWTKAKDNQSLVYHFYQHTENITTYNLSSATFAAKFNSDVQKISIPLTTNETMWYAVISEMNGRLLLSVFPGINSVQVTNYATARMRTDGYNYIEPGLTTSRNTNSPSYPPFRRYANIPNLQNSFVPQNEKFVILPPDQFPAVDLLHSELLSIINNSLKAGLWEQGKKQLFELNANGKLDKYIWSRIIFYIAQCDYYLGNLQNAYLSFLVSSEMYPKESDEWIKKRLK